MRILFAPLYEGIQRSLADVFEGGFPADKVIQRHMKANKKWGSHDRRLYAEATYDIVRWWRRLLHTIAVEWPAHDRWQTSAVGLYAQVIQCWCELNGVSLDRKITKSIELPSDLQARWSDQELPRAVRHSIPNWLDQMGAEQLGEQWETVLAALNTSAPVFLRANRLKTDAKKLVGILQNEKVEAEFVLGDALRLRQRTNVSLLNSYREGLYEVHDLNSQAVAEYLGVKPGLRVVDACAGAGGKSLHLAALMQNKGRIKSMDVAEKKLERLRERATRAGVTIIETQVIDSTKVIKRAAETYDRVLLDVPCSGMGVLRRNPDAKWKLAPQDLQNLAQLQATIIQSYSQMCKVGGQVVYATCSILPSENQQQVEKFLSQNENWKLLQSQTRLPEIDGADGFYMALLERLS
jgi:16S rRNA (cytosine967-C5)-methyltransferase